MMRFLRGLVLAAVLLQFGYPAVGQESAGGQESFRNARAIIESLYAQKRSCVAPFGVPVLACAEVVSMTFKYYTLAVFADFKSKNEICSGEFVYTSGPDTKSGLHNKRTTLDAMWTSDSKVICRIRQTEHTFANDATTMRMGNDALHVLLKWIRGNQRDI